ncbi:PleD family two-component system response regulator [Phormidesmis sp. 146-35]
MPPHSYRILIVDDVADNLFLLQTVLETEGYLVESATDGTSALNQFQASPPDLVLLDIMMPGLNGYQVAQRIRQSSWVPIVFMTAHDELSTLPYSEIGVNDLIRKPIDFDELFKKIQGFARSATEPPKPQRASEQHFFDYYRSRTHAQA